MTTIISRLYEDADTADAVIRSLAEVGATNASIVTGGEDTAARIEALGVAPKAAALYATHVDAGKPLVVAKAEFTPIGLAAKSIATVDAAGPVDAGVENDNLYIKVEPKAELFQRSSILKDHPLFLTFPEGGRKRGRISDIFGMKLLSKGRHANSVMKGSPHISTKLLPVPLLDTPRKRTSASAGGTITSSLFRTVSRSD